MKKLGKLKGSAILVVIFSSIAFYIYVMSVYSESEHFRIMQNKYEKNISEKYNVDNDDFYNKVLEEYNYQNNI